ncbi:MAG: SpoIID/LytB domain-containing protein [Chlorobi bacterium]|nr:SpoIID/LytB domain-containing protein [Chlorobiota bacterium]
METSPNILVGILSKKSISFYLSGKYRVNNSETTLFGNVQAQINRNSIQISNSEIKLDFKNEVVLLPCAISSDYFELKDVTIGIDFHWEQKEDQKFQGALKLLINDDNIEVINIIPIENYLASVISSEMNANSSLNLLKAHAIISRSWIIAQIEKQKKAVNEKAFSENSQKPDSEGEIINWYDRKDHQNYLVCADDHCQRYQGITRSHNANVIKAIRETQGQILKYDNEVCDTRYSKSCGGVSESYKNCWETIDYPYLTSVVDNKENDKNILPKLTNEENAIKWINSSPKAFCDTTDKKILSQVLNDYDVETGNSFRWKIEYSQKEIAEIINEKSNMDFGQIIDLIPVERGDSARLIKLKIVGTKKTLTIGKELEIRKWLSKSHLYSSAITIEKQNLKNNIPEQFIIKGAGWGHGVGLCQIGAAVMGEKGYSHTEILNHYYKGAVVENYY